MTTLDDQQDAQKKFAHNEQQRFKAMARRNRLLGLWVAEKLGKEGADAEAYAKTVMMADFQEVGDGDVLRKVQADLEAADASASESEIRQAMLDLMNRAIEEIKADADPSTPAVP